tara:strand:+ start:7265 stop:8113 length:849 start_codon:yes stop_codon:yes gene_type:complete
MIDEYNHHIITTGCSFTNFGTTWSDYLDKLLVKYKNEKIHNIGHKGNSNDIILRGIITYVDKLLKEGKNIDCVLIQLTTMERKFMINKGYWEMSPPAQNFLKSSWNSWFMPLNEGFSNNIDFWKTYWKNIHSDELHFFNLLENIFTVQNYLKLNNIKYKMFCGWDLFTDSSGKEIFSKTNKYENINNILLKDKFNHCEAYPNNSHGRATSDFGIPQLWGLIDWDNWWFFENEKIKYGGITEWTHYNLDKNNWYQDDLHPSYSAHEKFTKEVIIPLIDELKRD